MTQHNAHTVHWSSNKQYVHKRFTSLEQSASETDGGLNYILLVKSSPQILMLSSQRNNQIKFIYFHETKLMVPNSQTVRAKEIPSWGTVTLVNVYVNLLVFTRIAGTS